MARSMFVKKRRPLSDPRQRDDIASREAWKCAHAIWLAAQEMGDIRREYIQKGWIKPADPREYDRAMRSH